MTHDDLPTLTEWSTKEHMRGCLTPFIQRITIIVDGEPVGMAQLRTVAATPGFLEAVGHDDGALADPAMRGRGLGPRLLWSLLREIVIPAHSRARTVWAAIDPANAESLRTFAKAGFTREATLDINPRRAVGLLPQWL